MLSLFWDFLNKIFNLRLTLSINFATSALNEYVINGPF